MTPEGIAISLSISVVLAFIYLYIDSFRITDPEKYKKIMDVVYLIVGFIVVIGLIMFIFGGNKDNDKK